MKSLDKNSDQEIDFKEYSIVPDHAVHGLQRLLSGGEPMTGAWSLAPAALFTNPAWPLTFPSLQTDPASALPSSRGIKVFHSRCPGLVW